MNNVGNWKCYFINCYKPAGNLHAACLFKNIVFRVTIQLAFICITLLTIDIITKQLYRYLETDLDPYLASPPVINLVTFPGCTPPLAWDWCQLSRNPKG